MSARRPAPAGLATRVLAHELIGGVLINRRPLDQVLVDALARPEAAAMQARDRAFARLLAATVLRRQGELEHVLSTFLDNPLTKAGRPGQRAWSVLLAGAAQILCLGTSPHAAVDLAVEATRREPQTARFSGLANAVLRRVAREGAAVLSGHDAVRLNIPDWLWRRWEATNGADEARRIAEASLKEPPLDLSLKPGPDAAAWARRLGGRLLLTGSIRLAEHGRIEDLPGYAEGAWWVQGAAASLVARATGNVEGRAVADLCAAPGGKTAGLAAAGAQVTAVDDSPERLERLNGNLARLNLAAEIVAADVAKWAPARTFDAVVLDAPCSGTGTISRHPDILRLKAPADIERMAEVQRAMLGNAATLVRPGGTLVYSTCSLEPEEGRAQIDALLGHAPDLRRAPITAQEIGADPSWIVDGDVRTLPYQLAEGDLAGLDGFYIARLRRPPS
ncbi:MAG: RsmB/NOP family class I SAM-dependent RNA methyltransferase [Hyphomicrobiaceae bacterium]|nr:RsmB/NOP family class I SAM-dependent RNA methyltransferase [Hyphomicrobiaceae bacterium]